MNTSIAIPIVQYDKNTIQHSSDVSSEVQRHSPSTTFHCQQSPTAFHQGITPNSPPNSINGVKLFVGQLPPEIDDEILRQHFVPYGTVLGSVILRDKFTQQSKKCGFVTMATVEEANQACLHLNDRFQFNGAKRPVIVRPAGERSSIEPKFREFMTVHHPATVAAALNPPINHAPSSLNIYPTNSNVIGEVKLYVGMLSRESSEAEVRELFQQFGPVTEVYILKDKVTGQNKGNGFVKYAQRNQALAAIAALNDKYRDKSAPGLLQVRFADTPYEKNLKALQRSQNMQIGTFNRTSNHYGSLQPTAFAIQNPQSLNVGIGPPQYGISGNTPAPTPAIGSSEIRGPAGANLFVYSIPDQYTDADLFALFSAFGNVLSTKVQRDLNTGSSRGFGFVSFADVESAQSAITAMDGFRIGNKTLTVKVKRPSGSDAYPSFPSLLHQTTQYQSSTSPSIQQSVSISQNPQSLNEMFSRMGIDSSRPSLLSNQEINPNGSFGHPQLSNINLFQAQRSTPLQQHFRS